MRFDFHGYNAEQMGGIVAEAHERFAATANNDYLMLAHAAEVRLAELQASDTQDAAAADTVTVTTDGDGLVCVFTNPQGHRMLIPADGTPTKNSEATWTGPDGRPLSAQETHQ